MYITIQIKTLLFSFLFGFFFSFFLTFFYRFLYSKKKFLRIIVSFLLVIIATFIYFFNLKKINYAVFHIYEILCLAVGYVLEIVMMRIIAKKNRR